MMIRNGKEIIGIYQGKNICIEVYFGKHLIWQISRSCFGSGYWINNKPWLNDDLWKNN